MGIVVGDHPLRALLNGHPTMRDPRRAQDPDHVWEVQDLRVRRYRRERFDRIRYALRVLDALRPVHVDVTLCAGYRDLRIERGHAWRRPPGYQWALVAIPPDATREEIALALLDLAGVTSSALAVESLLSLDEGD
jgi:hypothetical protein